MRFFFFARIFQHGWSRRAGGNWEEAPTSLQLIEPLDQLETGQFLLNLGGFELLVGSKAAWSNGLWRWGDTTMHRSWLSTSCPVGGLEVGLGDEKENMEPWAPSIGGLAWPVDQIVDGDINLPDSGSSSHIRMPYPIVRQQNDGFEE